MQLLKFTFSIWNSLSNTPRSPVESIRVSCINQNVRLIRLLKTAHKKCECSCLGMLLMSWWMIFSHSCMRVSVSSWTLWSGVAFHVLAVLGPVNNTNGFIIQEQQQHESSALTVCLSISSRYLTEGPCSLLAPLLTLSDEVSFFFYVQMHPCSLLGLRWCKMNHFLYVQSVLSPRDLIPLFIRV